ncbi:uncharacterized protein LOC132748063 isoform X2 [Ruditapes philippinarum]|uniref:uncharacterized protein LOC132748063 isoform X2 n=1 Tax=Ruditapes philippinarum TaxID=129788 RepID=UPI00295AA693|nr:uncharacterized protein LOC132748063 isoform X2 [Ruditapes philippinarum]
MLSFIILSVCIAVCNSASQFPHGHELHVLVENGFNAMDTDKNGELSLQELSQVYYNEDLNHDGKLTLAEYAAYWKTTPEALAPIFNVWDSDRDGYVQASHLTAFGHLLDPNGDGIVTKHEYEHYMTGFLECVYAHGQHGHGPNCDH